MKEQLEQIIAGCGFTDRRVHLFDVRVESVDGSRAALAGRVLSPAHLDALNGALAEKLPGVSVDLSNVRVLRDGPKATRVVATNLTNLHREPSWLAELMTQVLNGTQLEVLDDTSSEKWACVRQNDGYLGWAYKAYLRDAGGVTATHIVSATTTVFREGTLVEATRVMAGTLVERVRLDPGDELERAHIHFAGDMLAGGWVHKSFLRPVAEFPLTPEHARRQMIADARKLTGVPYLWGGNTAFGIDCSGLAQLVHRLSGYTIPRDADMQFAAGKPVDGPPFRAGDLLFFGGESGASDVRKITHVGIATGDEWNMIHSSRFHNGVYEDDVQQRDHLRTTFAGARTFLPE